jgi:hypothetical protein
MREQALASIGGNVVKLGIKDLDKKGIMVRSVRWFIAKRGQRKFFWVQYSNGLVDYPVPDDCQYVIDVAYPNAKMDLGSMSLVDGGVVYSTATQDYSYIVQLFQAREMGQRILGIDPSWEFLGIDRRLRILPYQGNVLQAGRMWVLYVSNQLELRAMTVVEQELLYRRMAAEAKFTVGMIRRKYSVWPGAGGGVSVDGSDMVSESRDDMKDLDDEIRQIGMPIQFVVG